MPKARPDAAPKRSARAAGGGAAPDRAALPGRAATSFTTAPAVSTVTPAVSAPASGGAAAQAASGPIATGPNGHGSPSSLRRVILLRLRQAGPLSPDRLAGDLGASRTGVLQQLRALEAAHLVSRQTVRHGVGRPRHLYDVTPEAQDLFPSNYDGLAAGLLAAIAAVGGDDLVEQVFAARRRQVGELVRRTITERVRPGAPLGERVRELAVIQDEQGYLGEVSVDGDGTIRLLEHNCAIFHVAHETPRACEAELELFREVLGADVVRETHIATGDRCCTYRIGGRPS